ncbi:MAG: hypothetical protein LBH96_03950 [Candidatus Peribacteria bacterium]|nr:hypothetical protein [Candidatus Peribacteria bacterium]
MFILERVFFPQPNVYIEIEGSVTPPFPLPTTRHSAISENERQMRDVISAAPIISVYDGLEIDFQSTGTLGQDNFRHMEANFLFDLDDFFS